MTTSSAVPTPRDLSTAGPPAGRRLFRLRASRLAGSLAVLVAAAAGAVVADHALAWRDQRDSLLGAATGREGPSPAPAYVKVVFYGDSITSGFPLRALLPPGVVAENRGVPGQGIAEVVGRYQKDAEGLRYDILVIQGGVNDLIEADRRGEPEAEVVRRVLGAYRTALADARRRGLRTVVVAVHPVTNKFLLPYSRSIRLPTTFDAGRVNRMVRNTDDGLRALCAAEGAAFADIRASLAGPDGRLDRAYAAPDGYHLNVFGYRLVAGALPLRAESR